MTLFLYVYSSSPPRSRSSAWRCGTRSRGRGSATRGSVSRPDVRFGLDTDPGARRGVEHRTLSRRRARAREFGARCSSTTTTRATARPQIVAAYARGDRRVRLVEPTDAARRLVREDVRLRASGRGGRGALAALPRRGRAAAAERGGAHRRRGRSARRDAALVLAAARDARLLGGRADAAPELRRLHALPGAARAQAERFFARARARLVPARAARRVRGVRRARRRARRACSRT